MNKYDLLQKIKKIATAKDPAARLYLYGSRARGDENPDSDWDIIIILHDRISEREKLPLYDEIYELELESDEIINTVIHTEEEWKHPIMQASPFYRNITTEGLPI